MNGGSKPGEAGKKGDDLPLPAHAGFLIDALELVARRVDADSKAARGRFERLLGQEAHGEPRLRRRKPKGPCERASVGREVGVEMDESHESGAGRESGEGLGDQSGGIG